MPRVCVIGAGPAGLAMTRRLLEARVSNTVVYDRQGGVGGNWAWEDPSRHTSAYDIVRSISSKTMTAMEGYPFKPGIEDYPSREELLKYLRDYAENFGLLPYIRFRTEVTSVVRARDGTWMVATRSGAGETFDYVCVCTGHHWDPLMPALPGRFSGRLLHSHDFRNSLPFTGQRVLIIGCGNSGADIALDIALRAGRVHLSVRRGYEVIPRYLWGLPTDVFYDRLHRLIPGTVLRPLAQFFLQSRRRILGLPGLPRPDHRLFETHPLINSDLLRYIKNGRIVVVGAIRAIDGHSIRFGCGSSGEFDSVIACTGYRVSFPFLSEQDWNPNNGIRDLALRIFPRDGAGLCFIGLIQPSGSIWPLADLQAHLVAMHIARGIPFPKALGPNETYVTGYVDSPRHGLEVDSFSYRKALLQKIRQVEAAV